MQKLKLMILIYISTISAAFSDDLFGMKIYENAYNHYSKNVFVNKRKDPETKKGFYNVNISDFIAERNKSPYFKSYIITIDKYYNIHGIDGRQSYPSLEQCMIVAKKIKKILDKKYNIKLAFHKDTYPSFITQFFENYTQNKNRVAINCNQYLKNNKIEMVTFLISYDLQLEIKKFYESGF